MAQAAKLVCVHGVRWKYDPTCSGPYGPGCGRAPDTAGASNSPVTDGRRVSASFGSRGLYFYGMNGNEVWKKDFGVKLQMFRQFGEGAAPVLHRDRLIVLMNKDWPRVSDAKAISPAPTPSSGRRIAACRKGDDDRGGGEHRTP